jgi:hypothetical protein
MQQMKPVFTRYLYIKNDVIWTLFHRIIWANLEESLFWGYELYYSGFQEETFDLLKFIYNACYKHINHPNIHHFLEKIYSEWKENQNNDWLLATYIANIIYRKHDILGFINKYDAYDYERELDITDFPISKNTIYQKKIVYVHYSDKDIQFYKTILPSNDRDVSSILNSIKKYVTRSDGAEHCAKLRKCHMTQYIDLPYPREKIDSMLSDEKWLYYASATPIWNQRITAHKGVLGKNENIEFKTEKLKKSFFSKYGYIVCN